MADATLAEMTTRVLEKLSILIAGETAEAEDSATVQKVIVSTNEELRENEICYWDDSATPQHLVEHLAAYYACFLTNDYMSPASAKAFCDHHQERAMMKIRELTAQRKRVSLPARGTYF